MLPAVGVTARETNAAGAIFRDADPVTVPEVAVRTAVPFERPNASPVLLIVATAVAEELHVTELVRFLLLPSE